MASAAASEVPTTTPSAEPTATAVAEPPDVVRAAAATPRAPTPAARAATPASAPPASTPPSSPPPPPDGVRSVAVSRVDGAGQRIALTFDAGADRGYAEAILNVLAEQGAAASFGMTGQWAERHADLVRRMAAEGHQLINHTYDHDSFTGLSTKRGAQTRAQRWAQLDRTEAILQQIGGATGRPYFRPPYGDLDASVLADVGARGYSVTVMWSVDSLGWTGIAAPQITERTLRLATPGGIVVMHVGAASADAQALPAIIAGLRQRGYAFVTVEGLLAAAR